MGGEGGSDAAYIENPKNTWTWNLTPPQKNTLHQNFLPKKYKTYKYLNTALFNQTDFQTWTILLNRSPDPKRINFQPPKNMLDPDPYVYCEYPPWTCCIGTSLISFLTVSIWTKGKTNQIGLKLCVVNQLRSINLNFYQYFLTITVKCLISCVEKIVHMYNIKYMYL